MRRKIVASAALALFILFSPATDADAQQNAKPVQATPQSSAPQEGEPWNLQTCIQYAQENNIELQQQELSIEDATLAKRQAQLNYIPSVNTSFNSGTSVGRVLDPTTYEFRENSSNTDFSGSVSAGTELFAGMKKLHQLKKSELGLKNMLTQVEKARNDLSLNITAAYLDVLFSEEKVLIADQQISTLEMQVEQVTKLVEMGRKTMGDLLQLQSDLANARFQNIEAHNTRTLAYFNLCQMLEIEEFEQFRIVIPQSISISLAAISESPEIILEKAQVLPQVESAKLALNMADRDVSIAKAGMYPSLNVSTGYGSSFSNGRKKPDLTNPATYVHYPFGEQIRDNANFYISFGLSIPIFNSLSARNNVKSYKIAKRRAEYDYMITQKGLNKEIRQAFINATGAFEQYGASLQNVATTEETFRMIEEKYNLGAASAVDYSIALYNLVNARSQLAQAKYSYLFKTKILDFYKGIPIAL